MDANPRPPEEAYPCDKILFRAIPYDTLLRKDGTPKDGVFFRRATSDPNGLSVTTTIQACKEQFDRSIFGILSLHTGRVRDYELEVFPTSETHANIRYIPTRDENDPLARQIASDLMAMSRPVEDWDAENADELFTARRAERLI